MDGQRRDGGFRGRGGGAFERRPGSEEWGQDCRGDRAPDRGRHEDYYEGRRDDNGRRQYDGKRGGSVGSSREGGGMQDGSGRRQDRGPGGGREWTDPFREDTRAGADRRQGDVGGRDRYGRQEALGGKDGGGERRAGRDSGGGERRYDRDNSDYRDTWDKERARDRERDRDRDRDRDRGRERERSRSPSTKSDKPSTGVPRRASGFDKRPEDAPSQPAAAAAGATSSLPQPAPQQAPVDPLEMVRRMMTNPAMAGLAAPVAPTTGLTVQQKKALLWGSKKAEASLAKAAAAAGPAAAAVVAPGGPDVAQAVYGTNRWDAAEFSTSAEKAKFMKLLGVKASVSGPAPPPTTVATTHTGPGTAMTKEEQERVLHEQEEAFARGLKQTGGHFGLGADPLV